MTYQDFQQIPRIQNLGLRFKDRYLHFAGYLNFAISKAIQRVGAESEEDVIAVAVEILEAELSRYSMEREHTERRHTGGIFGLFRSKKQWI